MTNSVHHRMTGQLAAQYTKALLHDPKAPVEVNIREAIYQTPLVNAAPDLLEAGEFAWNWLIGMDGVPEGVREPLRAAISKAKGVWSESLSA